MGSILGSRYFGKTTIQVRQFVHMVFVRAFGALTTGSSLQPQRLRPALPVTNSSHRYAGKGWPMSGLLLDGPCFEYTLHFGQAPTELSEASVFLVKVKEDAVIGLASRCQHTFQ